MEIDYASLVEPRLGTNAGRWIAFSSACRPFGMVNLSPDTRIAGDWGCGYRYDDTTVVGFSHIHAWQISGILVMPVTGAVDLSQGPEGWKSDFSHATEHCKPGDHRLTLDRYGIDVELTATQRVGVHRYTFPPRSDSAILIDLASTLGPCDMGGSELRQTGPRTLEGWVINEPTVRKPKRLTIYFAITIDTDVRLEQSGTGRDRISLAKEVRVVTMRVAISYTSIDAARHNLSVETDGKSFETIRDEAHAEWNRWLSRIEVEGGTGVQRARFYTDLYFSLLGRRVVSDCVGTYVDNTGASPVVRQIPLDDTGTPRYCHHNSDAFWGAQWTITPLWLIAYPRVVDDFCRCFLDMYRNGGLIPRGPAGGNYTFVMTSAQTTPLYVAAMHAGVFKPEDVEEVYAALRKNHFPGGLMSKCGYEHHTCRGGGIEDYIALGYIPEDLPNVGYHHNGAGQTIEHAWNDWSLAQLARTLGKADDAELFAQRSTNWRNLFDRSVGFCRPRNRDGSWLEPFGPSDRKGWTEANAWTFTFHCPHDVEGLIGAFGSREAMLARLEEALVKTREQGYFVPHGQHEKIPLDFGNEPALAACHMFHLAGEPKRAQFWSRAVLAALKSGNAPTDTYGGDEDQGLMGAWNVLVAIGLFSARGACERSPTYQLTAPIFGRVTIHLDPDYFPGKTFTIRTADLMPEGFIRYASLNGEPLASHELAHADIAAGGELLLDLES